MQIKLEQIPDIETLEVGDALLLEDGELCLLTYDSDGEDFRLVNLSKNQCSDYSHSKRFVIEENLDSRVVRVIKSRDLILSIK